MEFNVGNIIIIMGLESVSASEDVIGDLPSPRATISFQITQCFHVSVRVPKKSMVGKDELSNMVKLIFELSSISRGADCI